MPHAFRCKNCNTLAESAHAGERDVPAKCSTCGAGVYFTPDGIKTYRPENWEVLADLDADALQPILDYHAITADEIEAHVPFKTVYHDDGSFHTEAMDGSEPYHEPQVIEVSASDVADLGEVATGENA